MLTKKWHMLGLDLTLHHYSTIPFEKPWDLFADEDAHPVLFINHSKTIVALNFAFVLFPSFIIHLHGSIKKDYLLIESRPSFGRYYFEAYTPHLSIPLQR